MRVATAPVLIVDSCEVSINQSSPPPPAAACPRMYVAVATGAQASPQPLHNPHTPLAQLARAIPSSSPSRPYALRSSLALAASDCQMQAAVFKNCPRNWLCAGLRCSKSLEVPSCGCWLFLCAHILRRHRCLCVFVLSLFLLRTRAASSLRPSSWRARSQRILLMKPSTKTTGPKILLKHPNADHQCRRFLSR
jgi:hypothetical protein